MNSQYTATPITKEVSGSKTDYITEIYRTFKEGSVAAEHKILVTLDYTAPDDITGITFAIDHIENSSEERYRIEAFADKQIKILQQYGKAMSASEKTPEEHFVYNITHDTKRLLGSELLEQYAYLFMRMGAEEEASWEIRERFKVVKQEILERMIK